jgi:hypothetical protein
VVEDVKQNVSSYLATFAETPRQFLEFVGDGPNVIDVPFYLLDLSPLEGFTLIDVTEKALVPRTVPGDPQK